MSKEITIEHNGKELKGVPYKDFLTFKRWRKEGKSVKKGEKSCYQSVSYPVIKDKKTGKERKVPMVYHLFHISQVQPIK